MTLPIRRTACILKPDIYPDYAGELISRILGESFTIKIAGELQLDQLMVDGFYHEHVGREYYERLSSFMQEGPVFAMVLERENGINHLRHIMGSTYHDERHPGQIRYEYGHRDIVHKNAIHGSDSETSAKYEINLLIDWLVLRVGG